MAKAFAKTYSNGYTDEFRATDWAAAGSATIRNARVAVVFSMG